MNWLKIAPLLFFALMIDGLQFLLSLTFMVIGMFPGTIGGCAIGQQVAGTIGCFAVGLVGSIPIVNAALAAVFAPIGVGLGFVVSICISFLFGSILVLFLEIAGVLDRKAAIAAYIGEVIPGFSVLPAWTALVVRCVMKQTVKGVAKKGIFSGAMSMGSNLVLPTTPVGNTMQQGTLKDMRTIVEAQPTYTAPERAEPRTPAMRDVRVPTRQTSEPYAQTV